MMFQPMNQSDNRAVSNKLWRIVIFVERKKSIKFQRPLLVFLEAIFKGIALSTFLIDLKGIFDIWSGWHEWSPTKGSSDQWLCWCHSRGMIFYTSF